MNTKNDKRMWFVHKLFEQSIKSEFYYSIIHLRIHYLDDLTLLQDNMALPVHLGKKTNTE